MMVTSSLWCGESYILYIDLLCAHYAGDVTIIQYIVYSTPNWLYRTLRLYLLKKQPSQARAIYIFSSDTNFRSYILYITQFGVLYSIHIYSRMVTSSLWCSEFYILYIDLPCAHYDITIIQYNFVYIVC